MNVTDVGIETSDNKHKPVKAPSLIVIKLLGRTIFPEVSLFTLETLEQDAKAFVPIVAILGLVPN